MDNKKDCRPGLARSVVRMEKSSGKTPPVGSEEELQEDNRGERRNGDGGQPERAVPPGKSCVVGALIWNCLATLKAESGLEALRFAQKPDVLLTPSG